MITKPFILFCNVICRLAVTIPKVLITGLGQLGLAAAKYVKERGFDTYGYDINTEAMEIAHRSAGIKQVTDFGSHNFDVYVICVSTHKPDDIFSPQIDGILSVADKISREANKDGALVSVESTISKGTSKKVFDILNHRLHVVHVPHRWYALEEKEHGVNQLRVIGGVYDCCLRAGIQFYNCVNNIEEKRENHPDIIHNSYKNLGIPLHSVSNIEIAETTKVVENCHRYLQVAFAEELYLYCQANNINFLELRDALNTKWNVNILEPRDGIGRHCLPKDTKMFLQSSKSTRSKILAAAMEVDEQYIRYRANLYSQPETKIRI
jgi:UDP-N-acetyl-D-mannosaminuronic acid dehydrogenase